MKITDLAPVALVIVVAVLVISYGSQITSDVRDDFYTGDCNATDPSGCGADYNISVNGLGGLNNLSSKLPSVGTIIGAAIIIGIIVTAFSFATKNQ